MPKLFFQCASLLLVAAALGGCSSTLSTTTCSTDSGVSCPRGGAGWSCNGSTRPDAIDGSLACSSGVALGTDVAYCCASVSFPIGGACERDSSVLGCSYGSYGFSCGGQSRPDAQDSSLTCSMGVVSGSSIDYCCLVGLTMSAGCSQDPSVTGCQGASYGFSCTGTVSPADGDPTLTCSAPTAGAQGASLYCCQNQVATTSSCGASSAVTGCVGGSAGYACTGTATPDSSLNCSEGVAGAGASTYYCCGGTPGTCAADGTVAGCTGGALGYSCTGATRPDASGSTQCSSGVAAGNGTTAYCCIATTTSTTSTCSTDPSVTGCTGTSYGFACTGTDRPSDTNRSLTCGDGAAGANGNTLYCCQG